METHMRQHMINSNWINLLKDFLKEASFGDMWVLTPRGWKQSIHKKFLILFKKKNWHPEIISNSQCTFVTMVKETPTQEDCLSLLNHSSVYNLTKSSTRTTHLPITTTRFHNETADITSTFCLSGRVGDEIHYLFNCTYFEYGCKKSPSQIP